ncbi:DUF3667 domain-containing protein [Sphingomonas sp. ID1715]|uniref:DUF3667 domain-containing protein n=1 Tax=Sphingomonas sp. ID1715 TaxID=1656898 RepID=UPI0014879D5B|nr:DUF3667 domain-containing protein [Sphingomonas sp. ID1715]NNM77010.1 DUF3667 domain-containing protein [Sphingomonas sp. ID1715]
MTGAEAAGELVTGALVAGAVERHAGARHGGGDHASLCLNCGTALLGDYCHRCGQPEHIHRSLSAIWHDLAHGVLHFEGKIWNTLPLLVWRPGELTRRFIHGERARFVSPMALFLFSVFLMFATFGAIGAHLEIPDNTPPTAAAQSSAKAAIPKVEAEVEALKAQLRATKDPGKAEALKSREDEARRELASLRQIASWQPGRFTGLKTGWLHLDEGFAKANKNPNLALYKMQSSAYKYSWALILLSTPFLWLLYAWHRKYKVYDHAVFVTYSLSFMSLLVIALTLLSKAGLGEDAVALAALGIPPLHIYRQLRGAYGTRRRWALLRTMLLVAFATITLTVFFLLLFAVGALG